MPMLRTLPYRKPTEGRDYWLFDDVLPNADAVRERCLGKQDWALGFPHTGESWPGRRAIPALETEELAQVEARVMQATGTRKLWVQPTPDGKTLNHNCVQVVGKHEGFVPPDSFVEDVRIPHKFNRLLVYSAALIHTATAYCGSVLADERMAAVFFWMG